jgi:cobalt-zinc-cadmium resistance protein CzcA
MGIELTDYFIALKPRGQWTKAKTQPELVEAMRAVFHQVPGMTAAFSQPIEMRMNEMIAGVRGDVAVKVYGDDLDVLAEQSERIQHILSRCPGAREVSGEQVSGQPVLQVRVNPEASARHGVSVRDVLGVVEALGTPRVGEVREGQRRFPLVVRLPDRQRSDPDALAATLIPTATSARCCRWIAWPR